MAGLMPVIQYPVGWARQPQAPVLEASRYSAEFAYSGGIFATKRNTRVFPTFTGSPPPKIAPSPTGVGVQLTGTNQNFGFGNLSLAATDYFTMEVLGAFTAAPGTAVFLGAGTGGVAGGIRNLASLSGNIGLVCWGVDISSGIAWRTDGKPQHVFAVIRGNGTNALFYRDGAQIASVSVTGLTDMTNNALGIGLGYSGVTPTGVITKAAIYKRALSPGEIRFLTTYPWQSFAPLQREIWTGPTAAIGGASNAPRYFHRTQAGQA
jgi:hypothetical protein